MKKSILPIICAVILIVVIKNINPEVAVAGIVIGAMIGGGVGALLNGIVFKKKDSGEEELKKN